MFIQPKTCWNIKKNYYSDDNQFKRKICKGSLEIFLFMQIRNFLTDLCCTLAELLCGRRPQKWSPILILRGMLVIFYGHGKRNGSRVAGFRLSFRNCISCVNNCEDLLYLFLHSAVQIYELHIFITWSSPFPGILWTNLMISSQLAVLQRSGFESRQAWFFQAFFSQLHKLR